MKYSISLITAALTALACLGGSALAQNQRNRQGQEFVGSRAPNVKQEFVGSRAPGVHLDQRYHLDHYYPPRGYATPALPGGSISIVHGGGNYFFHGGVWFRPIGPRFVVIAPPIGVIVPLLPPAYVSLWIGGAPYYYANGAYYAPVPGQGYAVVDPPPGADVAVPVPPPPVPKPAPDPIIYPRNGQSVAQTETDRQECNRWATTQPSAMADAEVFQRAVAACMDGRGYTVR